MPKTPVHAFTQRVENANEELRIVHVTYAVNKNGVVRYALVNNMVIEPEETWVLSTTGEVIYPKTEQS